MRKTLLAGMQGQFMDIMQLLEGLSCGRKHIK